VYGAGSFGRELAHDLAAAGVEVVALLDRKQLPSDGGIPVLHPDDVADAAGTPVVMGIFNTGVDVVPISDELLKRGFPSVLGPVAARRELARQGFMRDNYWLSGDPGIYEQQRDSIAHFRSLLSDQRSRDLLDAIIHYRMTGQMRAAMTPDPMERQYNPSDLPFIDGPIRFVDCGACDGDTLRAFSRTGVDVEHVVAFEPDPANFAGLNRTVATLGLSATLLPLGVHESLRQMRFAPSGAAGAFDEHGDVLVQCVALDEVLHGYRPTHVKMDIEGAEPDALRGMLHLGSNPDVRLAISIYHQPSDLWEVPLLIERQWPGRRMYVRQHGHQGFDTVLYVMQP
jgi:FkbM family methyltransferase